MITILTTGSNGLLGQKLTDLCLRRDDVKLIATGNGPNRHPVKEGYVYEEMDITNHERVTQLLEQYKPDAIIHGAAMTNVDACETQREACIALNVTAVKHIAEMATRINAHLVHISTDFIFDGTKKMYTEEDEANPLSFYGNSKWEGEKMVMKYATKYAILRTVLVYGVVSDMSRSNVVLWAMNALKQQSVIKVVDDQFRTPTLAEDLAMGSLLAVDNNAQGIYNISGKDYMSIYELVQRVAAHFGYGMETVSRSDSSNLNQPAKRPPVTGLDIGKARRNLGYEPHSFEEGLALLQQQLEK